MAGRKPSIRFVPVFRLHVAFAGDLFYLSGPATKAGKWSFDWWFDVVQACQSDRQLLNLVRQAEGELSLRAWWEGTWWHQSTYSTDEATNILDDFVAVSGVSDVLSRINRSRIVCGMVG